jgi:hypothetical protein
MRERPNYLTASQLARRLDLPFKKANRLIREGVLVPDGTSGSAALFLESRIPEFAMLCARFDGSALLAGNGVEK